MTVPASTSIRRSRTHNIDTDRLLRRQQYLVDLADDGFDNCERRREFVQYAQELFAIENELDNRQISYTRRTLTRAQSDAMTVEETE